jgi:hypothetical protein
MRLAILSDIHGNALALDAVLADAAAQATVDGYWVLGDLVAIGPDPETAVLDQLEKVRHPSIEFIARFLRGEMMAGWLADHLGLDVETF